MANCQSCGKEVPEGQALCSECQALVAKPPKRRGWGFFLKVALVAVVLVVIAEVAWSLLNARKALPLGFISPQTPLLVRLDVEHIREEAKGLKAVAAQLRRAAAEEGGPSKDFEKETGLSLRQDILPLISDEVVFALDPEARSGEPGFLLVSKALRPWGLSQRVKGIAKTLGKKNPGKVSSQRYKHWTIHQFINGKQRFFFSSHRDCVLVSSNLKTLKGALDLGATNKGISESQILSGIASQSAGTVKSDEPYHLLVYLNGMGLDKLMKALEQKASAAGMPTAPWTSQLSLSGVPARALFTARFTDKGIEAKAISQPPKGLKDVYQLLASLPPVDIAELKRLPERPFVVSASTALPLLTRAGYEILSEEETATKETFDNLLQGFGINLERDILPLLEEDTVFVIYPPMKTFNFSGVAWGRMPSFGDVLDLAIVGTAENEVAMRQSLDRLSSLALFGALPEAKTSRIAIYGGDGAVWQASIASEFGLSVAYLVRDRKFYLALNPSTLDQFLAPYEPTWELGELEATFKDAQAVAFVDFAVAGETLEDRLAPIFAGAAGSGYEEKIAAGFGLMRSFGVITATTHFEKDGSRYDTILAKQDYDLMAQSLGTLLAKEKPAVRGPMGVPPFGRFPFPRSPRTAPTPSPYGAPGAPTPGAPPGVGAIP